MNQHPAAPRTPLSKAGAARRQHMLVHLQREVAARGRRRRLARLTAAATPVLLLAIVVLRAGSIGPQTAPLPASPPTPSIADAGSRHEALDRGSTIPSDRPLGLPASATSAPAPARAVITRLQPVPVSVRRIEPGGTDLLERSRRHAQGQVTTIGDEQLALALRAAGRAAGVVRVAGIVLIVPDVPSGAWPDDGEALN